MRVDVDLLGGFAVRVDGRAVPSDAWQRRQAATLVKLLALAPRRTLHRELMVDALWPDVGIEEAAPRLHKAAHYARRALGESRALVLSGDTVCLFPDADVRVDADAFEAAARRALAAADHDAEAAAAAAATWTGDLLPDDPYATWTQAPRERLRHLHDEVLRRAGRWEDLVRADPADEEASLALAERMADEGDRRGALRQLERLERALRGELGLTPSPAVASLRGRLLAQGAPQPAGHRPPVRVLLGRDDEFGRLDRVLAAASAGHGRTVFVSGPAGIGRPPWCAGSTGGPRTVDCAWAWGPQPPSRVPGPTRPCWRASPTCAAAIPRSSTVWPTCTASRSRRLCAAPPPKGLAKAVTSGCSSAPPSCCGSPRPAAAPCWSWTTCTTPTRRACACCTTWPAPRSVSGSSPSSPTDRGPSGRGWTRCDAA